MTADLRSLALAATPGPWKPQRASSRHVITAGSIVVATAAPQLFGPERESNAAYIAACSPDRILRLLDVVDKARESLMAMEHAQSWLHDPVRGDNQCAAWHECENAAAALRAALQALGEK